MSRYSYQDARELSPHLEASDLDTTTYGVVDVYGRDSDVYDSDISFNDSSGYWTSLVWNLDTELSLEYRGEPPQLRMCDTQRALFDDAVSRYLRSHVDGAHVGGSRRRTS